MVICNLDNHVFAGSNTSASPLMAMIPSWRVQVVEHFNTRTFSRMAVTSIRATTGVSTYTGAVNFRLWETYTEPGSCDPKMVENKLADRMPCTTGAENTSNLE